MTIQQISNPSSTVHGPLATQVANWKNRSIVVVDEAYASKQKVNAGVGPGMFDGLGRGLIFLASLIAGVVSSIAVWATTGSVLNAAVTLGVVIGIGIGISTLLWYFDPKF